MILRPDQLPALLDKPLAPLYLLHGNEPLLVLEAADLIRAAARRQDVGGHRGARFLWTMAATMSP